MGEVQLLELAPGHRLLPQPRQVLLQPEVGLVLEEGVEPERDHVLVQQVTLAKVV